MTNLKPNQDRILIILVNYNGAADTLECIESLKYISHSNFQILVVDNASSDDSMPVLLNRFRRQTVVELPAYLTTTLNCRKAHNLEPVFVSESALLDESVDTFCDYPLIICNSRKNRGFAGGNNIGLKYAIKDGDFDYIWMLNNDTITHPDALTNMLHRVRENNGRVTCGSMVLHYHQPDVVQALGGGKFNRWTGISSTSFGRGLYDQHATDFRGYEKRLSYISGCSWLLPMSFINDIGLMDEDYFLYYGEIDWCERAKNQYGLVFAEAAKVWHKDGTSIGPPSYRQKSSLFSDYFIFKNKLRLVRRFNPVALPIAWGVSLLQSVNRIRRGEWDKARLILEICFGIAKPVR